MGDRHLSDGGGDPADQFRDLALSRRREKVVGSWNRLLVMAEKLSPSLANQ